jgi:hypothetical protein
VIHWLDEKLGQVDFAGYPLRRNGSLHLIELKATLPGST